MNGYCSTDEKAMIAKIITAYMNHRNGVLIRIHQISKRVLRKTISSIIKNTNEIQTEILAERCSLPPPCNKAEYKSFKALNVGARKILYNNVTMIKVGMCRESLLPVLSVIIFSIIRSIP